VPIEEEEEEEEEEEDDEEEEEEEDKICFAFLYNFCLKHLSF
jgi:hypothetical protein